MYVSFFNILKNMSRGNITKEKFNSEANTNLQYLLLSHSEIFTYNLKSKDNSSNIKVMAIHHGYISTNKQIAEGNTIYYRHVKCLINLHGNSIQYLCTCIDTGSTLVLASFRSLKCQCIEQVT